MPASTAASSKTQAVARLFETFRDHGYDGASLSALSRSSGLGRSSLYHHFPGGKTDMAEAVLAQAHDWLSQQLSAAVEAPGDPASRLDQVIAALDQVYAGGRQACLMGNFTHGEARTLFQAKLRDLFEMWIDGFSELAKSAGIAARPARMRAEDAVAAIEGALILSAGLNDVQPFRRCLARLPAQLLGADAPGAH